MDFFNTCIEKYKIMKKKYGGKDGKVKKRPEQCCSLQEKRKLQNIQISEKQLRQGRQEDNKKDCARENETI